MEGDTEESDEDVQEEDKPTVLWEKCIEQSIFVDLSEDESLHLSDLESSLALHLSQAESTASEASINLTGNAELSELEDTSSESSTVSSKSVKVESKSKSSKFCVSVQRPNTMKNEPPIMQECEDSGQNTSDEDQEDLPYDGDLGSPYFNQTGSSIGNSDGGHTVHGSPDLPDFLELLQEDAKKDNSLKASNSTEVSPPYLNSAHINQLLLRHFSQEELLQSSRLIEAETLPEVSLLESVDNTVLSLAPAHNSTEIHSDHTKSSDKRSNSASKYEILEIKTEKKRDHFTLSGDGNDGGSSVSSNQSSRDISTDGVEQEKAGEEDDQVQRISLVRTRSFSEMKYGQGQVHYPLPDFSKVAPKVKIPKTPSGPTRSSPQCPNTMHRAQSSPGMLEVISRVLEDSVPPLEKSYVFKDNDKQTSPALVNHLQVKYDKLLTKYAEAENVIDQMRLGTNTQLLSEQMLLSEDDDGEHVECDKMSHPRHLSPPTFFPENLSENKDETIQTVKETIIVSSNLHEDCPSDGERMTAELRDIISQFMEKVEEFKFNVSNMAVSTIEQQMMLRSMMEAQDQLERKYISKKEEHRTLEMQNYMGLSRNTGAFDPNRLVEGDIFRIGMHLEDIKEMIDKNIYEQISPPCSSSTPTPTTVSQHAKPGPVCMYTPSPSSSLHKGASAGLSTVSCKMNAHEEEINQEDLEVATKLHEDGGLNQSSELMTADPVMKNVGSDICLSWDLLGSLEGPDIQTAENKEGFKREKNSVLSEVTDHTEILANLSGTTCMLKQTQQAGSRSVWDLGDCVSLAVEISCSSDAPRNSDSHSRSEPPLDTSYTSQEQRLVSPETDSGFGSSYLNQSTSETFHPNLLTRSVRSQSEGLSGSGSEGSCSNLQTAIVAAVPCDHQTTSSHPPIQTQHCEPAAAAVELWLKNTTKEPSAMLQESVHNLPAQLHHHVSDPVLSMDTVDRRSPLHSCSCNSEAILALQSEVSRLKKELEEGLVQLPHLTQRMDYLTSKYRQECQGRRSKSRSHQIPEISSVKKSGGRGGRQLTLEDWISSDMDPSKSKGRDSDDTSCSEILLHDSSAGSRRGRRTVCSMSELRDKLQLTTQSNRASKSFHSKDRWSLLSELSLQKPLLQVSYGSSSSLPASYKVKEPQLQSMSHPRKRSTQSDSALLPSNVYFQRTPSPVSVSSRTACKTGRRSGKKEEDMNRTLDQAIEVALTMKRTTDSMAQRLSEDLAKAQLHRKLNMQPLGGSKHQPL
ncbi:uncharacterized protein LOC121643855 isoform X2 [Melanotaenia boesemani]|uniref:uncharacterized protein LOC121643855 isoform X2 n=1 Tax=Melanotaenia boesemani TaxID=1250792 RepID=UPI001C041403|nr:uncharacterized protein LOC121643855 isoform X2 [Melanotaenia boesemani]